MQIYYKLESSVYDTVQHQVTNVWSYYNIANMPPVLSTFTGTETELQTFLNSL